MRALALALAMSVATGAAAEPDYPALHDVTGVAANDVLNLRAAPNAGAPVVAALPPDARDIEVVEKAPNANWGRVNRNEVSGWANLRFLARQADPLPGEMPRFARCFGTEPFWSMTRDGTYLTLDMPDAEPVRYVAPWQGRSRNRADRFAVIFWAEDPHLGGGSGTISHAQCSDGMSDRIYGLRLDLILSDASGNRLYSGCCTLEP